MEAYYTAVVTPSEDNTTKRTYQLWKQQNPTSRLKMDPNKLGNVQRDSIKNRRLTDTELEEIKVKVNRSHRIAPNRNEIKIGTTENQEEDVFEEPSVGNEIEESVKQPIARNSDMDREKYLEIKEIQRKWEQLKAQDTTDRASTKSQYG
ncbi:Hypothetical predicted protein [Octopus vulgaris]|uniref:Uncharacterized protein n=1 Tax=Octopus vulgaris TaxID=6645 RepID=A0AA36AJ26_OCTVU|nr:Hypothetical predicted protein [Octopus vulgaris]